MQKTVILIRCVKYNAAVSQLLETLQDCLPGWTIIPVVDCLNIPSEDIDGIIAEFPVDTLALTDRFITNTNLHRFGNRTGWLCGDYAIYRALDVDWDYAWVVEPDVYFLNGAADILKRAQALEYDLLATHLWVASSGWLGAGSLAQLRPDLEVHAMAFPLFRVSRQAAEAGLSLRQSLTPLLDSDHKVPNDESIIATAVHNSSMSMLDLRRLYEEHFRCWSTLTRIPIADVATISTTPMIVHSGQEHSKFLEQMLFYWKGAINGSDFSKRQMFASLEWASKATLTDHLSSVLEFTLKGQNATVDRERSSASDAHAPASSAAALGIVHSDESQGFQPTSTSKASSRESLFTEIQSLPATTIEAHASPKSIASGYSRWTSTLSNGAQLDYLINNFQTDTLLVVLHGATDRKKYILPRSEWLSSVNNNINSSALYFSDPVLSLDETLQLGWYVGWKGLDVHKLISQKVESIAQLLGCSRIILTGSSGGGFASLMISANIPGSTAVVFNAQTSIRGYLAAGYGLGPQREFVERVMPHLAPEGFDKVADTAWDEPELTRLSAVARYSSPLNNRVRIVTNVNDFHFESHTMPFIKAAANGGNGSNIQTEFYSGPTAHVVPGVELFVDTLVAEINCGTVPAT